MNLFSDTSIVASQRPILDLPVCDFGWADALAFTDELASMAIGQTVISFLNANNANLMMKDAEYRAVLSRQVILPDGHGVDIASWLFHGRMFPANLNGTDFVPALLTYMAKPKRIALIGASPSVLKGAVENFQKHTPWHEFIPISDGYFDVAESDAIMARVRAAKPDILLVAMGSPKQEKWIDRHVGPGHARLVISVGALFDFMAGEVPRASETVRGMRLEWLHRLVHEPGRLWRRYIFGNPVFLYHILRHKLGGGAKQSRPTPRPAGSRFF
ncbi:WecB/TagA/CpsF family glycosyltransferase [Pararhizobium antarcticum]|uniref:UDP-N-acetyl-D-mannosaminuronic acid transferase n=1 Tax=Pararhizobium antarcticum TaxID=1798805 RepID=A0A657LS38_9HYPH|nr:WecB/TagA/CpsF family glycosyltransferase [Pararhizobium antarcticum]OJF95251.1 UDP-N-acetyl-D-mannosaminuronic acid transferase [Rhizobium sp. 58]OJF95384.1 UDP-N-acetyl-D-mannosaminuronic acid transferase [Pararhizobium antarcticum]